MFLHLLVSHSVYGGFVAGGCVAEGACMAGGGMAGGCVWQRGHAWQGMCVTGGVHGRGRAWQGACMARDVHGMYMEGGCVVWGGGCAFVAGETATTADGMRPTGMHSC